MKRLVVFAVILVIAWGVIGPGMGQERESEADPTELVAEMADLLDRALYLAIAALSWPDRDDLTLYIQGVINLIDGPNSLDYDDSDGVTTPDGNGLKDLFLGLQISGLTTTEEGAVSLRPSLLVKVAQAIEHTESYLFLAAEAAKRALDKMYSIAAARQELRAMYAYLLAARGRTDAELTLGGVQALVEVYPSREIWLEAEPSIQAAIDRASPGSTIHLGPGTYQEKLVIDKDITLIGVPRPTGDAGPPATVIVGTAWAVVVAVEGSDVEVRLENLLLVGGTIAVATSGANATTLDRVWIQRSNTGLSAYDGASVSCDRCRFDGLQAGMILRSGTETSIANSTLRDARIQLFAGSSLTMTDTTVSDCGWHAITLQGDSKLHLEGCSIYDNEGFGVSAHTAECDPTWSASVRPELSFTGTITGANNAIPGPDEEHGNLEGDVCPAEYLFLKDPAPGD